MQSQEEKVLITGVTGYVGSWVTKYVLDQAGDRFKVKVAVRNPEKFAGMKDAFGEEAFAKIEVSGGFDLYKPETVKQAVSGCTHVIYCATPMPGVAGQTPKMIEQATVEGTRALLEGCTENKVKKLIVTSDGLTMVGSAWKSESDVYTEHDYAFGKKLHGAEGYINAKIQQEQELIKYREKRSKEVPEDEVTEIVTIHPGFMVGPAFSKMNLGSTPSFVKMMMDGRVPYLPKLMNPTVDIRDVGQAHVNALLKAPGDLQGKRFPLAQKSTWTGDMMRLIDSKYRPMGYTKIATKEMSNCLTKMVGWFEKDVAVFAPMLGKELALDNSLVTKELDLTLERDIQKTFLEMVDSMIEFGMIEPDFGKAGSCEIF